MGIDNVLAVAGAAHGNFTLVIMGLAISVPIVVWGSSLFIRLIDSIPALIYVGAGILAWTAAKMLVNEPLWHSFFLSNPMLKWLVVGLIVIGIVGMGALRRGELRAPKRRLEQDTQEPADMDEDSKE